METVYKCLKCRRTVSLAELRKPEVGEISFKSREVKVKCPSCGGRILFKPRQPMVKVVKAI